MADDPLDQPEPVKPTLPPRRPLPRAARLSRLSQPQADVDVSRTSIEALAARIAQTEPPPPQPPPSVAPIIVELKPDALVRKPAPEPVVDEVTFKPVMDQMAQRSVVMSTIGFVLCLIPVFSVIGAIWGFVSLRRIERSEGALMGLKTARFGLYLGLAGLVVGATADMMFLIRR